MYSNELNVETHGVVPRSTLPARKRKVAIRRIRRHWQLYLVILLPMAYLTIFKYVPMFGAILAFKNFNVVQGILGSPWAGFSYFNMLFSDPEFPQLIKNTLIISLYHLLAGFPIPILLALALNEVSRSWFKKVVQMVSFAPYFISVVVMMSMVIMYLDPTSGIINQILGLFGIPATNFLGAPNSFRSVYVWSDIWQNAGYGAIIYIAALAGIDPTLYEAAKVDGASRFQKILHVDIPGILPVIVILLILNVGSLMSVGFEKILLLQNPLNIGASEIISTYTYKMGLLNAQWSFGAAVGLFNSVINTILLVMVNIVAKRVSSASLW